MAYHDTHGIRLIKRAGVEECKYMGELRLEFASCAGLSDIVFSAVVFLRGNIAVHLRHIVLIVHTGMV